MPSLPLVAHAQTRTLRSASTNTSATTAAATTVEIHTGSALSVLQIQQLELVSGRQTTHSVLQRAVGKKVSADFNVLK